MIILLCFYCDMSEKNHNKICFCCHCCCPSWWPNIEAMLLNCKVRLSNSLLGVILSLRKYLVMSGDICGYHNLEWGLLVCTDWRQKWYWASYPAEDSPISKRTVPPQMPIATSEKSLSRDKICGPYCTIIISPKSLNIITEYNIYSQITECNKKKGLKNL